MAAESDAGCREVCADRLDEDEHEIDSCLEILNDDGEPAVACVLEPDYRVIERAIRLETMHVTLDETVGGLEV